jgi:hypothetical protein
MDELQRFPKVGDEVIIRARIVEDFGDDLMVRVEAPRGGTVVNVARRHVYQKVVSSNLTPATT